MTERTAPREKPLGLDPWGLQLWLFYQWRKDEAREREAPLMTVIVELIRFATPPENTPE
mgnify:CR=1 FL=1